MDWKDQFLLRRDITFLNFGSFGATPVPIFNEYQRFQRELEAEPVQFITKTGPVFLAESRKALGAFIGCRPDDVVFVPNPTYAVNTVARSLNLQSGDEVLSTSIEYGACDRAWKFYCAQKGARYVQQPISLPIQDQETFLKEFWNGCTARTKLIFISHITSATGLILPIELICKEARNRGILVFIDGAHVPAHIPLDLKSLRPDFYTGACHKWMMTPKGSSFLYVEKEQQKALDPLIVSWGYDAEFPSHSIFLDYHQFNGTRDFSAYLTIPKAIEFMEMNNWTDVARQCRDIVQKWLPRLCAIVGSKPLAPISDTFIGQLGSIPIRCLNPIELKEQLYNQYKIEIPVMVQNNAVYLRFSINAFNTEADLELLEQVIKQLLATGMILPFE